MTHRRLFSRVLTLLGLALSVLLITLAMLQLVQAQGSISITISKSPDSQMVTDSSPATFTIGITNTGDVTLTNVMVSDALTPDCNRPGGSLAELPPGEGLHYTCVQPAVTVDLLNLAVVTGTDTLSDTEVTGSDTAFVDVIHPGIEIAKTPNTQTIVSGSTVTFTIHVTNTGDITLTNVTVTDALAPNCAASISTLTATAHSHYECTLGGATADFTNTIAVTGAPPVGDDVTDTDTAFVDVIHPGIEIAKLPDSQLVVIGQNATFTIIVTNTGDVPLTNVLLTDALAPDCNAGPGDLEPGEIVSGTCSAHNIAFDFTNTAIVTATPPIGDDIQAADTAIVDAINPVIEIAKTPDLQTVSSGSTAHFTIVITNSGDTTLTNVTVSDAQAPGCDETFATLAVGNHETINCSVENVTDGFINSATVTGQLPEGGAVTNSDAAQVVLEETQTCPADMIAYWRLDETTGSTYDDYYNGHDAQCAGDCPTPAAGHIDGGQAFNGSTTGLDAPAVPGDDSLNWAVDEDFTIELWAQVDVGACSGGNQVIVGRDDTSPSNPIHWWVGCRDGGEATFYLTDGGGTSAGVAGITDLRDASWHHIVAVRDASANRIRIYVDGAEENATVVTYTAGFGSSTAALNIGWINIAPYYHYDGALDELALYDRALSADEVRQHHNEGLAARWYCQSGDYAAIIVSEPVTEATAGRVYTYDVEAAGDPTPSYALLTRPDGMTIDSESGLISWTPTVAQEGDHAVEVEASNTQGADTQNFTITVAKGTVCPVDMLAYWKLDETGGAAYDDFFDGLDGECAGQCPATATGMINGGQIFNGSDTGIDVPADAAFDWSVSDSFSIEFWMRSDSACATGNQVIIGRDDSSTPMQWWVGCQTGGNARFYLQDSNNNTAQVSGGLIVDDAWHHIVAIRDAGANRIRIYVDGVGQSSFVVFGAGFGSATAELNIGWLDLAPYYHFEGSLDEVAIYDRALSEAEIQQHHDEPGPGYCINPEIAIAKSADLAISYAGHTVAYLYTVTNPGDDPLSSPTLTDDKCSSITFVGGDDNADDRLDPDETWQYNCSMSLSADTTNTATITATHTLDGTVSDVDSFSVNVITPDIAVDKEASATLIQPGDTVTYTYSVTNPGDDPLSGVNLSDDKCSPVTFVEGDANINSQLDPDETWLYTCAMPIEANTTNTATVTGTDSIGSPVNAADTASVSTSFRIYLPIILRAAH
ncbi:MAG: DUF7507 domain-containing protein [Chloroflexota bacterium]